MIIIHFPFERKNKFKSLNTTSVFYYEYEKNTFYVDSSLIQMINQSINQSINRSISVILDFQKNNHLKLKNMKMLQKKNKKKTI